MCVLMHKAAAPWQLNPACIAFPDDRNAPIGFSSGCNMSTTTSNLNSVTPPCSFRQQGPWQWLHLFPKRNVAVLVPPKVGSTSLAAAAQEQCAQPHDRDCPKDCASGLRTRRFSLDTAMRVLILRDPWDRTLSARADSLHAKGSLIHVPGCTRESCSIIAWATGLHALCHQRHAANYWESCRNEHLERQAFIAGPPDQTRFHYVALLGNTSEMNEVWSKMLNHSHMISHKVTKAPSSTRLAEQTAAHVDPGENCSKALEFCKTPSAQRGLDPDQCCRAIEIIQALYADDYVLARGYRLRMESDATFWPSSPHGSHSQRPPPPAPLPPSALLEHTHHSLSRTRRS